MAQPPSGPAAGTVPGDHQGAYYSTAQQGYQYVPGPSPFATSYAVPAYAQYQSAPTAPQEGAYFTPGHPGPEQDWGALYGQAAPPGAFQQQPFLPYGSQQLLPPGTGLAYMDPYGMMNPAAIPPLMGSVAAPKKQAKKKNRACC